METQAPRSHHRASEQHVSGAAAARAAGWIAIDRWGGRATTLVVLVILGRLLPPADFGMVAMANIFLDFTGRFVDQGYGRAIVQRQNLEDVHTSSAFWLGLGLSLVMTLALFLLAPLGGEVMGKQEVVSLLRWMSLILIFYALSSVPAALLERGLEFRSLAARRLSATLVGGVLSIAAALAGAGVWSLVIKAIAEAVIGMIALWATSRWRPRFIFQRRAIKELWPVSSSALGVDLLNFTNLQADQLLIGTLISARALGFYFLATRIVTIMVDLFTSIFSALSLTLFSRYQNDLEQLRGWLYRLTGASSALALPSFALAAVAAPVIVPFVFGDAWGPSVVLFQVLALSGAAESVALCDRNALVAVGRARLTLWVSLTQTVLGTPLLLAVAGQGMLAIAFVAVARRSLEWPLRVYLLKRTLDIDVRKYVTQILRPALAAAGMCGAVYFLSQAFGLAALPPWLSLALMGAAGLLVYLALSWLVYPRQSLADVMLLIQKRRRPGVAPGASGAESARSRKASS